MQDLWAMVPVWIKWIADGSILFSACLAVALICLAARLGRFRPSERLRGR